MMQSKLHFIALILALLVLTGCSLLEEPAPAQATITPSVENATETPTLTPLPTNTPTPTPTPTPTQLPPTLTPTHTASPAPSVTPLSQDTQLSIFENLWSIVNDTYVYPDFNGLDWDAVHEQYRDKISAGLTTDQFYHAMRELIFMLGDDHSIYLTPGQVVKQEAEMEGKVDYVGIGALVSAVPERNRAVILSVFQNSPAEAAGLKPRDSILSIDGESILDEFGYLKDIVRGPEGTTITIAVQSPGEELREIRVTRHQISGEVPVDHSLIVTPYNKRIGYILLVTFTDSTVDEQVAEALRQMTTDGPLDGLILDNRMNAGGSSTVFQPMLSYFTDGELGVFVNRREERPLRIELNDINGSSQVPLVVLIGPDTASFGEIFAGVLKDIGRAYLIGQSTDGNVEILWGYELEDGSRLWLANETFRPHIHADQDWEKTGITPDITVSGEFDEYSLDEDPAVVAAIQYLSNR